MSSDILFSVDDSSVKFPNKLKILDAAQDNMVLHMEVQHEGMHDVYLSMHKVDYEPQMQLKVNAIAYEAGKLSFEVNSLNNVNGEY